MSNFDFLKTEWPDINKLASKTESFVRNDVRSCCFYARLTLEIAVKWMYRYDNTLTRPKNNSLAALVSELTFTQNLSVDLLTKIATIRKTGNDAAHDNKIVTARDAIQSTKDLYHFLYWFARTYTTTDVTQFDGLTFDDSKIPPHIKTVIKNTAEQLKKQEEELRKKDEEIERAWLELADTKVQIEELKKQIAEAKKRNQAVPDTHNYSEAETRKFYIDKLLHEVGWRLDKPEDREYKVTGMPNESGIGYVDYVLWGDDGKPLAVVEAKKTSKDSRIGEEQARLYADCLETQFGQRPFIFYTNGYETYFWDNLRYPSRRVQGFYKKNELEALLQRRKTRKLLNSERINNEIVDRYYQIEAITRVAEHFENKYRKSLLVMATGTGKTRTVVALCDLLQRCNWIKRVLFLVDRKALVKQACNAFKAHLADSNPVNVITEGYSLGSRVYVSTYPTMMNLIDEMEGDTRTFSVGHFDLIVIDEAHRSIYKKYKEIFEYFDSFLVGLTATPKAEVDRDTYRLFDLPKGDPTFAYDLDQGVNDKFLVPFYPVKVTTKFHRDGIKYDELSENEKDQWDSIDWNDEGEIPDNITPAELNIWLFNADTVDKVIETLMIRGEKVEGGDKLGKTIIFARNHKHALFIKERFDKNYPHYKGEFARIIDNYEPYAETLLDQFDDLSRFPQIAISVDMLDTGIDIEEIVNLVFFKPVFSKTKFHQMIGRGTRLCKDLYGPGEDKKRFLIFDFCGNFDYFNQQVEEIDVKLQESLETKIFKRCVDLLESIHAIKGSEDAMLEMSNAFAKRLKDEVNSINVDNFIVRTHIREVEKFRSEKIWDELKAEDYEELRSILASLPKGLELEDETAKRFDLLMLTLQLAILKSDKSFSTLSLNVRELARMLEGKSSVPMVQAQMPLIQNIQNEEYWSGITLPMLEEIRRKLRDLIKFIDKKQRHIIYSDFEDSIIDVVEGGGEDAIPALNLEQYKKRVEQHLRDNQDHIVIGKLKHNLPLTHTDLTELDRMLFESGEIGTREEFEQAFPGQNQLGLFIRSIIGLDRAAAIEAFSQFLNGNSYNANQIRFVNMIIDYLTQKGMIDKRLLYEQPFVDINHLGLDGVFSNEEDQQKVLSILDNIRDNAAA